MEQTKTFRVPLEADHLATLTGRLRQCGGTVLHTPANHDPHSGESEFVFMAADLLASIERATTERADSHKPPAAAIGTWCASCGEFTPEARRLPNASRCLHPDSHKTPAYVSLGEPQ